MTLSIHIIFLNKFLPILTSPSYLRVFTLLSNCPCANFEKNTNMSNTKTSCGFLLKATFKNIGVTKVMMRFDTFLTNLTRSSDCHIFSLPHTIVTKALGSEGCFGRILHAPTRRDAAMIVDAKFASTRGNQISSH